MDIWKIHSKFHHEVYYHAYASDLAGFSNTCIRSYVSNAFLGGVGFICPVHEAAA